MEPVTAARSEVMNYYDYYYYYFRHLAHTLPKYSYFYLEKKKNNEKKKIVWNAEFIVYFGYNPLLPQLLFKIYSYDILVLGISWVTSKKLFSKKFSHERNGNK
ncbi:unnamed protein product [Rhizophagus irregularis]|nr:unnamed protein product [Rhizophagus irregularis]CAB4406810.1 unnamed protein product [Rhizophagus irregularis]